LLIIFRRSHNNLRITRILKCLSDFKLEDLQIKWLEFLIQEVFVEKKLLDLASSLTRFWIHTIKDNGKRIEIIGYVEQLLKQDRSLIALDEDSANE
jgi:hypothetical protein